MNFRAALLTLSLMLLGGVALSIAQTPLAHAGMLGSGAYNPDIKFTSTLDKSTGQTRDRGFVEIRNGRELYIDFLRPEQGKPTVVLLNGLTYRTGCWDDFVDALKGEGLGILRYDPMGHGRTLGKYGLPNDAYPYKDQVKDLKSLLDEVDATGPVHLLGLSYGGAIGTQFAVDYPSRVASLILMAPFTKPLESQDQQIKMSITNTRIMFPYNPASDDELYDYFLKQIVYSSYPMAEPIVLEYPSKLEATFRLVQGVRKFLASKVVSRLPANKTHLIVARQDQYLPGKVLEELWSDLPKATKMSRLFIDGSEHKIPEAVPRFSAEWIKLIVNGDARLRNGKTWEGNVRSGKIQSGSNSINVK